jgi:hypothetical protein
MPTLALQVDPVFDIRSPEDAVATSRASLESQGDQQTAQLLERDRGIGIAPEDALQQSLVFDTP